jgi:gliding motility-associated-like protein
MKKYLFSILFLVGALMTSKGQFAMKDSVKMKGDEITFVTLANLDSDSLPETIASVRKGSLWYLYAIKFPSKTIHLLADSIAAVSSPTLNDWDGDHQMDVVFPVNSTPNFLLLINQGNLQFKKVRIAIGSGAVSKVLFKPLTNDERRQAIVKKNTGGWSVYHQEGNTFSLATDSSATISDFHTFDFDGNGYPDIALSGTDALGKSYLKILELQDSLQTMRTILLASNVSGTLETEDLDHDGKFDLVVTGKNDAGQPATQSFLNHDSLFVKGAVYPALSKQVVTLADFDSDGKVDFTSMGENTPAHILHWIKTFSGDSVSLPASHVTHRAFGDYDRDGDLDLLVSTDTLGLIIYQNAAAQNRAPSKPTNEVSALIYNRVFLYWDVSSDDHTPASSLTYDLLLTKSGSDLLDGEFDFNKGLRHTATHGNRSGNNFLLMRATAGSYVYKVEGVDNSLYAKEILQGTCNGSCTIQEPKTITTCHNLPTQIRESQPVLWFSFSKGFMGKSSHIKLPAVTDTVFSFLPHATTVCNAITIYLVKNIADTLKISQHFAGCENSTLAFKVAEEWKGVSWKDAQGNTKGSGNTLNYQITKDDKVIATGSNANGCFIRQTENIRLSKPVLELDGTEYRILYGNSVSLGASGAQEYLWEPSTGLNDVTSSHPLASPLTTITYTVTGFDSLRCTSQANVMVEVYSGAFVPNLFTPNGDGRNDELRIYGLSGAAGFHFRIYNREGSVVYETTDWAAVNWDGTRNGTLQPAGLYYWKVEGSFANGEPLRLNEKTKGSILLVR